MLVVWLVQLAIAVVVVVWVMVVTVLSMLVVWVDQLGGIKRLSLDESSVCKWIKRACKCQ